MEILIATLVVVLLLAGVALIVVLVRMGRASVVSLVEFERVAVFRDTGEFLEIRGPGLVSIRKRSLFSRRGELLRDQYGRVVQDYATDEHKFDLRERAQTLGDEHCITGDSAVVSISPAVVYQIMDPEKLVLNVQNHYEALATAINATLRAAVGAMTLTNVITGRESIATEMRARLQEQADRWGISIISLEIQDIKPAPEVEMAMNERRAAEEEVERDRLDLVVRAEARLQGAEADNRTAIAQAEAEKQASITHAEAQRQSAITIAEGEKEADILRADGAAALYKMLVALGPGADVALRYEQIQALKALSESNNAKLVIAPTNLTNIDGARDISVVENLVSNNASPYG